jgi:two-component system response regulator VanR
LETRILIVDDEPEIGELAALYLRNEGFIAETFLQAGPALARIREAPPDLAILDIMLPDMNGFALCRLIREEYAFPVVMLTAKNEESDKINGLALGADDYIVKPFRPLELVARVKAQLRRFRVYNNGGTPSSRVIALRGLLLDADTHSCRLDERELSLTPLEFSILWELCAAKGRVVSAEELFSRVWGEKYFTSANNTVMVHIRHLREKMGESAEHPRYIRTVWGVGYRIEQ